MLHSLQISTLSPKKTHLIAYFKQKNYKNHASEVEEKNIEQGLLLTKNKNQRKVAGLQKEVIEKTWQ